MALLLTCANDSLHVCTAHKALMLYCTLLPGNPKSTIHRPLCASDHVNVNSQTRHNWRFALCIKIFALCTLRRAQGEVESSVQNALLVKCLLCQPASCQTRTAINLTSNQCKTLLLLCLVPWEVAIQILILDQQGHGTRPKTTVFLGILSKWVPPLPQYPQCKHAFVVDFRAELSK